VVAETRAVRAWLDVTTIASLHSADPLLLKVSRAIGSRSAAATTNEPQMTTAAISSASRTVSVHAEPALIALALPG
jgi:hypothetical protein